jgi:cobalt/nickel transport system permease protein
VPLAAVLAGLMTLIMSLEIAPLAYEPHLTVLTGILVGPAYGFLAAFVFNVLRLLLGDGSVTLLGLNTLLLGLEAVLGAIAFRALAKWLPRTPGGAGLAGALATVVSLAVSTAAFLTVAALGSVPLDALAEEGVLERLGDGAPQFGAFAGVVLVLGLIGWVIEGAVVGAVVAFVRAVRPALVVAE